MVQRGQAIYDASLEPADACGICGEAFRGCKYALDASTFKSYCSNDGRQCINLEGTCIDSSLFGEF